MDLWAREEEGRAISRRSWVKMDKSISVNGTPSHSLPCNKGGIGGDNWEVAGPQNGYLNQECRRIWAWLVGRNWCILDCNSLHKTAVTGHAQVQCCQGSFPWWGQPGKAMQLSTVGPEWSPQRSILAWSQVPPTPIVYFFFPLIVSLEHWQKCHTRTTHMAAISQL